MLASPIRVKSVSTPSAAKAWAKRSETYYRSLCFSLSEKNLPQPRNESTPQDLAAFELRECRRYGLVVVPPRRSLLPVLGCSKRVGAGGGSLRLLSYQLRDVLGKLGKDCTSEVHPTRICKGFERAGNVEMAFDLQQGRVASSRLDTPRGVRPRSTPSINPAPLDRAASERMVISEFGLAAKYRHGRSEFHAHRPLVGTVLAGFG